VIFTGEEENNSTGEEKAKTTGEIEVRSTFENGVKSVRRSKVHRSISEIPPVK